VLPSKSYTPEEILRILWSRKWLILAPFVVATLGTGVTARRLPKIYRSETVILVVPQRVPETYVRSTVTSRIEERLASINPQILSRSRLEPIIREFGLYAQELRTRTMEEVVESMRRFVTVKVEGGNAFRISFMNGDPQIAQKVTQRLAALYIAENLRDREIQAEGTNQFLDSQLEEARRRLIEREKKLEAYKTRNSGELPGQVPITLQSIQTLQLQLQGLSESIDRDHDRRVGLEKQIADLQAGDNSAASAGSGLPDGQASGPRVTRDPADPGTTTPGTGLAQQLQLAQAQLQALQTRYTAEHPDVAAAKRLVQDLEAKLMAEDARTASTSTPPVKRATPGEILRQSRIRELRTEVQNLDKELARKLSEQQRVEQIVAGYRAKVDAAPSREAELTELTRDYATLQQTYTGLLSKREEAKVAANLERNQVGEQFKMLDPARVPERPFSPDVIRLNMMGAGFGLAIGLALAAFLEYRDSTFHTELDVTRALDLLVLASVPLMVSPRERRRQLMLLAAGAATLVAVTSLAAVAIWKSRPF
jgi:polysaccharide chain length determinant protein (PEP-CTERM system associated)